MARGRSRELPANILRTKTGGGLVIPAEVLEKLGAKRDETSYFQILQADDGLKIVRVELAFRAVRKGGA